ncbi:hypothetical protein DL95DRAFT_472348 [Leptodontidium sp. 2 PMI_412]|nr:hypothetical protein DL95DRAFT_472348 [Leptodontidium sp. 2 PMI_412]
MTVQTRSTLHVHVTPPGSFTACPLTPPTDEKSPSTVLRILEDIKNRTAKTGGGVDGSRVLVPWAAYSLDAEGYQKLLQRIQRDETLAGFAEQELRLDYFLSTRCLVLRMPSALCRPSGDFAHEIKFGGSSRIKFDDPDYGAHDPDGQFQHADAQFPGVVIEVSYSQKKRDLPHLADDYILGSDTNIQVVVGLDIEYGAGKERWLLGLSHPHWLTTHLPSQLQIPLHAFAPSSCYPPNVPPTGSITIPAQTLCKFLADAERTASMMVQKTGLVKPTETKTWGKKRRREIRPTEELLERDEKRWKREEDRVGEREIEDDASFKGSVGSDGS